MKDYIAAFEIRQSVKDNNLNHFFPFDCSICGCKYGYYFNNDNVIFNGNCDCTIIGFGDRQASYEEIAQLYNRNKNEKFRQYILDYFKI